MANVILGFFVAAYILMGIAAMVTLWRKRMTAALCVYASAFAVLLALFPLAGLFTSTSLRLQFAQLFGSAENSIIVSFIVAFGIALFFCITGAIVIYASVETVRIIISKRQKRTAVKSAFRLHTIRTKDIFVAHESRKALCRFNC